jgi:hypothetical protein
MESPRKTDGNTLGCATDNNVKVSQRFFALKLSKDDLVKLLGALQNASAVTDWKNPQIVKNGGPVEVQKLVKSLGVKTKARTALLEELSSGVELISKPSALNVPPWQMVSSLLKGVSLRTATWWANPKIHSTTANTRIGCWSDTITFSRRDGPRHHCRATGRQLKPGISAIQSYPNHHCDSRTTVARWPDIVIIVRLRISSKGTCGPTQHWSLWNE